LFCLRHVLKSLTKGGGRFAPLVGNLISARTQKELGLLVALDTPDFAAVMQPGGADQARLTKCLMKVGLKFAAGSLQYLDA
jgi:hypothetical protein